MHDYCLYTLVSVIRRHAVRKKSKITQFVLFWSIFCITKNTHCLQTVKTLQVYTNVYSNEKHEGIYLKYRINCDYVLKLLRNHHRVIFMYIFRKMGSTLILHSLCRMLGIYLLFPTLSLGCICDKFLGGRGGGLTVDNCNHSH